MLQTIHAEVDVDGQVHLLEEVFLNRPRCALLTILEDDEAVASLPTAATALAFLRANRLPADVLPTPAEIEAQIAEARNSWE